MTKTTRIKMMKGQIINQNMFQKKIIRKESINKLLNIQLEIEIEMILLFIINSYTNNYLNIDFYYSKRYNDRLLNNLRI